MFKHSSLAPDDMDNVDRLFRFAFVEWLMPK